MSGRAYCLLDSRTWLEAWQREGQYVVVLVHLHRAEGVRGYAQRRVRARSASLLEAAGAALADSGHDAYAATRALTERRR